MLSPHPIQLKLQPLSPLRVQHCQLDVAKAVVRVRDVRLFREVEWSRTLASWFLEGMFPIGLTGIELQVNVQSLLASRKKASSQLKKKRRSRIPRWIWRVLFKALSRVLVNVLDMKVRLEDIGVIISLQQVAVLFKSERDVPCRAALKARDLKCAFFAKKEARGEVFEFFNLNDLATTASVALDQSTPSLHSVKLALEEMDLTITEKLIESGLEFVQTLPKKTSSTPKTRKFLKTEDLDKFLGKKLPRKIGGALHHLKISMPDLASTVVFKNLHFGLESKKKESLELTAGLKKLELKLGIDQEKQGLLLEMPHTHVASQFICHDEILKVNGGGEIDSIKISVDDDLVLKFFVELTEHAKKWKQLSRAIPQEVENQTQRKVELESPGAVTRADTLSIKSDDSDPIYRKLLDSGDISILQSAEEQEFVEEVPSIEEEETLPAEKRISPLIECAACDWDLSLTVKNSISVRLLDHQKDCTLLEFSTQELSLKGRMLREGNYRRHCMLGASLKRTCVSGEGMSDLIKIREISGKTEGSLLLVEVANHTESQGTLSLASDLAISGVRIKLAFCRLQTGVKLFSRLIRRMEHYEVLIERQGSKRKVGTSKSLKIEQKKWSGKVTELNLEHEMEIHPVDEYRATKLKPSSIMQCQVSSILAESGSESPDFSVQLMNLQVSAVFDQKAEDQTTLLSVRDLSVNLRKQAAVMAIQLSGDGIQFDLEIDIAIILLQLTEDAKSIDSQIKQSLKPSFVTKKEMEKAEPSSAMAPEKVQCSAQVWAPVRVPSEVHSKMRNFIIDVLLSDLSGSLKISDSDILTLTIPEVTMVTRKQNPRICLKQLAFYMNNSKFLECEDVKLKVVGPCYVTELVQEQNADPGGKDRSGIRERGAGFNQFIQSSTEDHPEPEIPDSKQHQWRMKGCTSMGIVDYIEEDYSGEGTVLDFLSIDIEVQTLCFNLPHNENVGRVLCFSELWIEAVKDVIHKKLPRKARSSLNQKMKDGPADLIEICFQARRVLFRLDPHPMESWLSIHRPHLLEALILKHGWENALKLLQTEIDAKLQTPSIEWIQKGAFRDYKTACGKIKEMQKDLMYHEGALMSVAAENVEALVLVGDKKSPNIIRATIQKIKEMDSPTSHDITFGRVQPIYIIASADNIHGHFEGLDKPSVIIKQVEFHGLIARGRQLSHHPELYENIYPVGRWHRVKKQLPLKGARPPMKVYTDMDAVLHDMDANGGIGLESVFCQLGKAFNRLIPPSQVNSDGTLTVSADPILQTWDKIRYTWRGKMLIEIHALRAAVAANLATSVDIQTPRLELQCMELKANVIAGGIDIDAHDLEIVLFDPGLRAAPEAPLRDLPLCVWPEAKISVLYKWQMPQGRSPLLHHAFPVVDAPDPEIRLKPVDLFELFVGEGYTLEIHADLENHLNPEEAPQIIMGEAQVRFLIDFFKLMEDAPVMVRGCWKRGTYFLRKDRVKKYVTPELPNLLHRIAVSLKTPTLDVKHHSWEIDDPSDQLHLTCEDVRFNGTWAFLNKIADANALREGRFVKKKKYREIDGVWRQMKSKVQNPDMEDLAVSVNQVEAFLPENHKIHPILTREAPNDDVDSELLTSLLSSIGNASSLQKQDSLLPPEGLKGRVLTARSFNLKQKSKRRADPTGDEHVLMPNGEIKRPLHIQLSDVKVLMPLEVRNAVVGVYLHMLSAFLGPPKPPSARSKQKQSIKVISEAPAKEQEQKQEKEIKLTDAELLETLLKQDEEGTGPRTSDLKGSSYVSQESPKVDPPPPDSKMILHMEFHNVQLSCLSNVSMGGVLVCLEHGSLFENFSEEQQIRSMGLRMHQVQAYHMKTQIDPMHPIRWLELKDHKLSIPRDSQDILSLILHPFEVELSDLHLTMLAQAKNPGRAAEELKIYSSRIEAITDSEQFETLVDVINSVATPPPPDIKLMNDTILGPTGSALEDTSEEISEEKERLKVAYRGFNDLRHEAYRIHLLSTAESSTKVILTRNQANQYLQQKALKQDDVPNCRSSLSLVLYILEEQIEIARKACSTLTSSLRDIRKHVEMTNKHRKHYKSMDMQLFIENVIWRLITKKTEFMLAQIKRVFFKSFQNKDLSGESKVSVYRIELRDTKGIVNPGLGLDQGVVLSVLEPTGSDEEFLHGLAIRGTQTSSHVYYEHIEGWVHRFGLNFNETIAMEVAGFFFPSDEDEIVRKHEENWAKFADSRYDPEQDIEPGDKGLRQESLTGPTFEIRPRASSFLAPLVYTPLPSLDHRPSFKSNLPIIHPENDPLAISFTEPSSKRKRKRKGLAKSRKIQFVHVRFNKIVAHVTYTGRPLSFKDLTLTLGTSEYNSLEGSWRGLFKKYRNGIIGSVIKSIASHEGRSYDPKMALGVDSKREKSATSRLLDKGRMLFHRKEKIETVEESDEDEQLPVDVMDEKEGRNLLLGKL